MKKVIFTEDVEGDYAIDNLVISKEEDYRTDEKYIAFKMTCGRDGHVGFTKNKVKQIIKVLQKFTR